MSGVQTRSNMKNNKEERKEEENSSDDETYLEEMVKESNEDRETQYMNFVEGVYKYMEETNKRMETLKKNNEDQKMETQKLHEIIRELKYEKKKRKSTRGGDRRYHQYTEQYGIYQRIHRRNR